MKSYRKKVNAEILCWPMIMAASHTFFVCILCIARSGSNDNGCLPHACIVIHASFSMLAPCVHTGADIPTELIAFHMPESSSDNDSNAAETIYILKFSLHVLPLTFFYHRFPFVCHVDYCIEKKSPIF